MGIRIISPGALTTVQDAGRYGFQRMGFPVSGVMDMHSFRIANMLLSNDEGEAVLEATLLGPTLVFTEDCLFAITGADMAPRLNGKEVPRYAAVCGHAGEVLELGMAKEGARAYLAFAGGLDISPVMGSRSTNLKCGIGGFQGRKLLQGDVLAFRNPKVELPNMYKRYEKIHEFGDEKIKLRVLLGPQEDAFTAQGIETFLGTTYTVTKDYDRMGCRLDGAEIESKGSVDIVSDGIAFGSVQIPASGKPIVMMADHQTTGGYAKIATVISPDLPKLAQCMPGDCLEFQAITPLEAEKEKRKEERWLRHIRKSVS